MDKSILADPDPDIASTTLQTRTIDHAIAHVYDGPGAGRGSVPATPRFNMQILSWYRNMRNLPTSGSRTRRDGVHGGHPQSEAPVEELVPVWSRMHSVGRVGVMTDTPLVCEAAAVHARAIAGSGKQD